MARLPRPGSEEGYWGDILNEYLLEEHYEDGTHNLAKVLHVPATSGKVLASDPASSTGTAWQVVTKASVGLASVTDDAQLKLADLDTDTALAASSNSKVPSQHAVKQYVDTKISSDTSHLATTGGTVTGTLTVSSRLNVQPATSSTGDIGLYIDKTYSPSVSGTGRAWAMQFKQNIGGSANLTDSNGVVGFEGFASHNGTGTVQALAGSLVYARSTSSGAVTNMTGMLVFGNQNLGTGVISNSYNVKINSAYVASGSITNNYGLYIDNHTQGTASNYAIYTNAGQVRFGDTVVFGGGIVKKRTAVNDVNYTVQTNDHVIAYTALSAGRTVTVPAGVAGKTYVIKDESGQAATRNITVVAASGTIDGAASKTINTNYGWLKIYYNGTNWFIIS